MYVYSRYEYGSFYGCEGVQHSAPNSTRSAFSRPKDLTRLNLKFDISYNS